MSKQDVMLTVLDSAGGLQVEGITSFPSSYSHMPMACHVTCRRDLIARISGVHVVLLKPMGEGLLDL